jgi:D-3-phosphoglycerate dehydrogenase
MKPTAYLINTARGPLIDVEALAEALKNGKIAGAAIDVYGLEPPPGSFPLLGMENVILTPHMAWASEESGQEIRERILEDILLHAQGKLPLHVVNKEVLEK